MDKGTLRRQSLRYFKATHHLPNTLQDKGERTMSKHELISMIETMNNYDELAAKAKRKADAIREAIKEEMVSKNVILRMKYPPFSLRELFFL